MSVCLSGLSVYLYIIEEPLVNKNVVLPPPRGAAAADDDEVLFRFNFFFFFDDDDDDDDAKINKLLVGVPIGKEKKNIREKEREDALRLFVVRVV